MKDVKIIPKGKNEAEIIVTKKFHNKATEYGTEEYKYLRKVFEDFPKAEIKIRSISKNEKKERHNDLTIAKMLEYIKKQSNNEELLEQFETIKNGTVFQKNTYPALRSWFIKQFPNYRKAEIQSTNIVNSRCEEKISA